MLPAARSPSARRRSCRHEGAQPAGRAHLAARAAAVPLAVLRLGPRDLAVLALIGGVMGWVVGALWDIQDWVTIYRGNPTLGWEPGMGAATTLVHFARFYLVTSLAYDTFRAVGNVIMVLLLGAPVLAALSRLQARLSFEIVSQT